MPSVTNPRLVRDEDRLGEVELREKHLILEKATPFLLEAPRPLVALAAHEKFPRARRRRARFQRECEQFRRFDERVRLNAQVRGSRGFGRPLAPSSCTSALCARKRARLSGARRGSLPAARACGETRRRRRRARQGRGRRTPSHRGSSKRSSRDSRRPDAARRAHAHDRRRRQISQCARFRRSSRRRRGQGPSLRRSARTRSESPRRDTAPRSRS